MAIILTPQGEKKNLRSKEERFSLLEISDILEGLVEVLFLGNKWVFINKAGYKMGLPYNEQATAIFNHPIAGSCIIANDYELPCQFFIPEEFRKEIEQLNSPNEEKEEARNKEEDDDNIKYDKQLKSQKEQKNNKSKEDLMKEGYYLLFETGKDFNQILENFIIYRKGNKVINYTGDKDKQILFLAEMQDFYQTLEEYEKCAIIKHFLEFLYK